MLCFEHGDSTGNDCEIYLLTQRASWLQIGLGDPLLRHYGMGLEKALTVFSTGYCWPLAVTGETIIWVHTKAGTYEGGALRSLEGQFTALERRSEVLGS